MFWIVVGIILVSIGLAYAFNIGKVADRAGRYRRDIEPHLIVGAKPSLRWYVEVERWMIGVGFTLGGIVFVVIGAFVAR
jgi:hypothetical protein